MIDLPVDRIADLVRALGDDFEVDVDMLRDALLNARSCNIFYLPTVVKLDLFAVGRSPFDASEFARRSRVLVRPPAGTLVVKSPEDTVLRKLRGAPRRSARAPSIDSRATTAVPGACSPLSRAQQAMARIG